MQKYFFLLTISLLQKEKAKAKEEGHSKPWAPPNQSIIHWMLVILLSCGWMNLNRVQ
jgi:hypothetical protein